MILIDTSAWIEFLRDTGSDVCNRVDRQLDGPIASCDPVAMEVLAGARSDAHLADLRGLLARTTMLPTLPVHYEQAAAIYRTGRRAGLTIRRLADCLIAAVAIDHGVPVLHADRDFDAIRHVTRLVIG
ncbi:MAG: PIN domain-containing protein [Actinomycetales bacterium]|nr:PIN domain-containing protein [Actinomycetales bacterium]